MTKKFGTTPLKKFRGFFDLKISNQHQKSPRVLLSPPLVVPKTSRVI
jgi:hypothetical protein